MDLIEPQWLDGAQRPEKVVETRGQVIDHLQKSEAFFITMLIPKKDEPGHTLFIMSLVHGEEMGEADAVGLFASAAISAREHAFSALPDDMHDTVKARIWEVALDGVGN